LVFGAPQSPLAKPRNVIGGHLISAALGLLAATLSVSPVLAMAVGVGLAIAGMLLTDTLHPPAGADPIVVVLSQATLSFLLMPVLVGTLCIVLIGVLYHRFVTGHVYP
jgi:CBS-domain-containing membrane protein